MSDVKIVPIVMKSRWLVMERDEIGTVKRRAVLKTQEEAAKLAAIWKSGK